MPSNRFKKKDQQDSSNVTRPNKPKQQFGRRPMHPSYLLQRAMRSPQSLSEEDRFHLRNQVDPKKLQDIFGGRTEPQQQNGMGGDHKQTETSSPDSSPSLANTTPFSQNGTMAPKRSEPSIRTGGGDKVQRLFGWSKKEKEEDESSGPQSTTQENDVDTGTDEPENLPETLPVPTSLLSTEIGRENTDGLMPPRQDESETNGLVDVNQLLQSHKQKQQQIEEPSTDNNTEQTDKPGIFKRMGQGISGAWQGGVDYVKWLTSSGNVGGRGERRTARYNNGYMGFSIVSTITSYILSALKAGLVGLVNVVSYGISGILSTIHACIAAFRAHRAKKRLKTAGRLTSMAEHRYASARSDRSGLDPEERNKYDQAVQQLETWRKQHEKNVGEGGDGITTERNSDDMKNMRFYAALEYFKKKTKRKRMRSIIESTSYAASAVGGTAVGIGSVIAGAGLLTLLASNPIGWGIAATLAFAGTIFLIGSAIYAGIRKYRKKSQGKVSGRKREFFAKEVVDLAAGGYQPAIAFLKDVGILRGGRDMKKKGKFEVVDLNDNTKRPDLEAMFARKFSSWY